MRVKVYPVRPAKKKLPRVTLSELASWDAYGGMTDEQDEFHRQTYLDYINGKKGPRAKRVYVSEN